MENNDSKQPLLLGSLDPTMKSNEKSFLKRRRYVSDALSSIIKFPEQNKKLLQNPELVSLETKFSLKLVFVYLGIYFTLGTLCFYFVRHQIKGTKTNPLLDAMYFCVVTMTTVGYGDLVPDSVLAKLLSCVFVFSGMCIVGFTLSKAADYLVEKEEIFIAKMINLRQKMGDNEILKEVESNKARYKFFTTMIVLSVLVVMGTVVLYLVEEMDFVDAFYCVCVTITTLGYGDDSFSTQGGRLFAVFWILISTICLAQFLLYIAELQTEKRQRLLIKSALTRKLTSSDLEAADIDNDKAVSAAEFIVYKLKEMGKISEEDISVVMEGFQKLDIDRSGTLTTSDLVVASQQSSEDKH